MQSPLQNNIKIKKYIYLGKCPFHKLGIVAIHLAKVEHHRAHMMSMAKKKKRFKWNAAMFLVQTNSFSLQQNGCHIGLA
jgi:hypothetical protein